MDQHSYPIITVPNSIKAYSNRESERRISRKYNFDAIQREKSNLDAIKFFARCEFHSEFSNPGNFWLAIGNVGFNISSADFISSSSAEDSSMSSAVDIIIT
jgi:hypothetical protein